MSVPENIETLPLFFILGRTRSGTTMLRSMFDAHPNVVIPPEFPVLASVRKLAGQEWNEATIDRFVSLALGNRKFSNVQIPTEKIRSALQTELKLSGSLTLQTAFRITHSLYISSFAKERLLAIGDKNPLYAMYADMLRALFPEARFVFLRRHLLSVVDSVCKTNFELHWPAVIAYKWRKAHLIALRESARNPNLCINVKYEDIVSDPEGQLLKLCTFTEISFHHNMLAFNNREKLSKTYGEDLDRAHRSLLKEVGAVRLPDWKQAKLRRHRIALAWAGKSLSEAGYNQIMQPCLWYYYLLGVPSFVAFRAIRIAGLFFRILFGNRFHGNFQMRLAGKLYGSNIQTTND